MANFDAPKFMQDKAHCHKAKLVLSFLEEEEIAVMTWPLQSTYMNSIENVLKVIGKNVQSKNSQNIN